MNHTYLLRLFARNAFEYDCYNEVKAKCCVTTQPVYFNTNLAKLMLASNPF